MQRIRVLVADDSATVRERLIETLAADPGFVLVGVAEDGKQAVDLCVVQQPDVITMDMAMPAMSGLSATEYIMAHRPTPILIVSSSLNRGDVFKIYDALAAGAVDALDKPAGDELDEDWDRRLRAAVRMAARIKVITHPRARLAPKQRTLERSGRSPSLCRSGEPLSVIAVGASTGGPGAVVDVLRQLPPDLQTPILVVVHMNAPFEVAFADWLDGQVDRRVLGAENGVALAALRGCVAVARGGHHLVVRNGRVSLTLDAERHACRPSVDVLFESIAVDCGAAAAACLLTGMGRDGADGLLKIREAGGITIAQDAASSVIYGMPRAAVELGAATYVLPLSQIGFRLAAFRSNAARLPR